MDGNRLRLPANRNCYRLLRVSWRISSNFLLRPSIHSTHYTRRRQGCRGLVTKD